MKKLEDYLYYEEKDPDLKIYCGDCLEILGLIENESFDSCVTDPPFGIGFKYDKQESHDNADDYWNWLSPIYQHINRVTKPGAFISVWQANKYFNHFWNWFGDDIRIYAGCKNFVQLRKTPINYGFDPIVIKYKSGIPLVPLNPERNIDFFVANTAKFVTERTSLAGEHPCPRPVDQVNILIANFVIEYGKVLEPFLGSGTTLVACKELNRSGIGIEINEKYCEIAKKRLRATCKPLFTDVSGARKSSAKESGQNDTQLFAV